MHIQSVINGTAFILSIDMTRKELEKPKELKIATFPCEGFVNKYHFMRVSPQVLKASGWEITGKRFSVELDLKDGALVVRKPSK